ncbi:MAG: NAD-dependent epimerase/dehydratase family protein, partial [Deltaproteobacteria bacterium]
MKRVLITGAGGQLGGCFARYLDQKGIEVEAAGRQDLDIRDFSAVSKTVGEGGFDAVINCAAFNDVDGAESAVHEAIDVNALGPRNLAIACEREGAVLMHFSTDYVFGGGRNTPFTIADIPNPLGAYARSKLLGERLVREQCPISYVVRVSWVFAPDGRNNFVAKMLGWAEGK